MTLNDFLIEAHKALDAATVEDGLGNEPLCMIHLGTLHGLIIMFLELRTGRITQCCKVCGCTDLNACPGGCSWVEPDLCSKCV